MSSTEKLKTYAARKLNSWFIGKSIIPRIAIVIKKNFELSIYKGKKLRLNIQNFLFKTINLL